MTFEVLAGLPDIKTSKFEIPQPPLFANTSYDLVLISVDKYGNECTKGGAVISGKLTGPNLPPGQDANVEVVDNNDGSYVLKLWLKAPADIKLIVTVARDIGPGQPPNILEFPHLSLSFMSLKAWQAKMEREAKQGNTQAAESGDGSFASAPPGQLQRSKTMASMPLPAQDSGGDKGAGKLGKAAAKLKAAASEVIEGFGAAGERREKQVLGDADKVVEMAVDAFQKEGKKKQSRAAAEAKRQASSPPKAAMMKRAATSKLLL